MNHTSFPSAVYTSEINRLEQQLAILTKTKNRLAWARFAIVLLAAATFYYLYASSLPAATAVILLLAAVFIRLVIVTSNIGTAIENTQQLLAINQNEVAIAAGTFASQPNGSIFNDTGHAYTNDLDIFGTSSLYQYLNRTTSQQGNTTFAGWLMHPADTSAVLQRQDAAKELAPQYQWRQQLQAYGTNKTITTATQEKINAWAMEPDTFSNAAQWKLLRWVYPVITVGALLLYLNNQVSTAWFVGAYLFFLAVSSRVKSTIASQYVQLNKIVPEVSVLSKTASWIESNPFKAAYLQQLQMHFSNGITRASANIKQLENILDKFDFNLNLLFVLFINPFILWDLQMIFSLEHWRRRHKAEAAAWFTAVGELEAVSTLSAIHFNHPHWVFPSFDQQHGTLQATGLAHPLIPESKCVPNDFATQGTAQVALITGSNMAGKSTFLRSIGVNTVLALAGAPVCAIAMRLSPMRIISSMRVADNLQESTSTFYAELKKLQSIIAAVNQHEKVFVLLDEILRGTNSLDRHTGSKALVKQLIKQQAVAMLATHDVELAQLQQAYPAHIHNYHFDAQIAGEELYFDYKLKEGICQSINASLLMKKIGIEL